MMVLVARMLCEMIFCFVQRLIFFSEICPQKGSKREEGKAKKTQSGSDTELNMTMHL